MSSVAELIFYFAPPPIRATSDEQAQRTGGFGQNGADGQARSGIKRGGRTYRHNYI